MFGHLAVAALAGCTKPGELIDVARGHLSGIVPRGYLLSKKFEADNAPSVRLAKEQKRYAYSGKRMAELLRVTPDEEKALSVIVGADVKAVRVRVRKTEQKRLQRRRDGVVERAAYEAGSVAKARPWEAEGISRASWYRRQKVEPEADMRRA